MAYNITATDTTTNNELLEGKGPFSGFAVGIGLAVTTTLTVTVPSLKTIRGVVLTGQAGAPTLTSTSANTFTATTSSADTIHWIAWGDTRS
jgi:hypothetical protein